MTNHRPPKDYADEIRNRIELESANQELNQVKLDVLNQMNWNRYAYNFTWFGRPVIQIPQDAMTFQEMIWEVRPDLIIETGIAHGGSLIFSASMLALLELFGEVKDPLVLGLDIDIRQQNRKAIEGHPAFRWIEMIEGSSVSPDIVTKVKAIASQKKHVMLFLDSNHTHEHVLAELEAYAGLVTVGSFAVVLDTGVEDIDPSAITPGRPWCKGNSPKSALNEFMNKTNQFVLDDYYHQKAWVTSAPSGIIRRIS